VGKINEPDRKETLQKGMGKKPWEEKGKKNRKKEKSQ